MYDMSNWGCKFDGNSKGFALTRCCGKEFEVMFWYIWWYTSLVECSRDRHCMHRFTDCILCRPLIE